MTLTIYDQGLVNLLRQSFKPASRLGLRALWVGVLGCVAHLVQEEIFFGRMTVAVSANGGQLPCKVNARGTSWCGSG